MMTLSKYWKPVLATTLAIISIPLVVSYNSYAISHQPEAQKADKPAHLPSVSVITLKAGQYQSQVSGYAEVSSVEDLQLSSQVTGSVVWRNPAFEDGNKIASGEILLKLDDTDYRYALAEAEQNLATAKLVYQQEKQLQLQAKVDWEKSGIREKPTALALRKPQLESAEYGYKAAQEAVKQAKRNLSRTKIKAPFPAIILSKEVALGSYVEPGNHLATLRSSERAEVQIGLTASQWALLESLETTEAELLSRNGTQTSWQAKPIRVAQFINQETRLRDLTLSVDNPLDQEHPLLFGSFVTVKLSGKRIEDLFEIPASALTADGYIWTVENQKLSRYKRTPLFAFNGQLYITRDDLPEQITLLTHPMTSYLPGSEINPVTAGTAK